MNSINLCSKVNDLLMILLALHLIEIMSSFTKVITTIYSSQKNLYTEFLVLCLKFLKTYLLKDFIMYHRVPCQVYLQTPYYLSISQP